VAVMPAGSAYPNIAFCLSHKKIFNASLENGS
jgi:hypothetical protein